MSKDIESDIKKAFEDVVVDDVDVEQDMLRLYFSCDVMSLEITKDNVKLMAEHFNLL